MVARVEHTKKKPHVPLEELVSIAVVNQVATVGAGVDGLPVWVSVWASVWWWPEEMQQLGRPRRRTSAKGAAHQGRMARCAGKACRGSTRPFLQKWQPKASTSALEAWR